MMSEWAWEVGKIIKRSEKMWWKWMCNPEGIKGREIESETGKRERERVRTNNIEDETSRCIAKRIDDETWIVSGILQLKVINHKCPSTLPWRRCRLLTNRLNHVMIMEPMNRWFWFSTCFTLEPNRGSNLTMNDCHFITCHLHWWHLNNPWSHYYDFIQKDFDWEVDGEK